MKRLTALLGFIPLFFLFPSLAQAASDSVVNLKMTDSSIGYFAVVVFILAYTLVMAEEFLHLRKSKPVMLAAGIMWIGVAWAAQGAGMPHAAETAIRHNILEYAELFLFLLVAMTYVNSMEERGVFETLRAWLVKKGFSYRQLFWITGVLAFVISPIADNLTTALLMCAVVMAVGKDNARFVSIGCINIVVAANAGGAFSPFGDITTLMVWQKGILRFGQFFQLVIPSIVSYVIPAVCMHMALPKMSPPPAEDSATLKPGAYTTVFLFLMTIVTAVSFHNFLHLPPVTGMMTGLAYLQFYGYYLKKVHGTDAESFDFFRKVERAEWDTLLFFYGIILCVGALSTLGYLEIISHQMYTQWGAGYAAIHSATPANIAVGVMSAIVDNIPVMFAVLTMHPLMSEGQWLLVTLTAGVGGSMLSIGSAAGVALMGQARGKYTFFSHLKWTWAIALGYAASIVCHIYVNSPTFHGPAF